MARSRSQNIDIGVYSLGEVARYARLHPVRVRRWFVLKPSDQGKGPIFHAAVRNVDGDLAVGFLDLIDTLIVGRLRDHGVSLHTIRIVHSLLTKRLDTTHPFAHSRLSTDGRAVFITTADEIGDDVLSEVVSRQQFFKTVIEPSLSQIDYDDITQLAARWRIAPGVVLDPRVRFGKPVVDKTGVTTFVLAGAYEGNSQNADLVGDLFGVRSQEVLNAVEFESTFGRRRAA